MERLAEELAPVLVSAQASGFLGAGDLRPHIVHAASYLDAWPPLAQAARVLDLGSGAGIPGLVLALLLPATSFVLLDGRTERAKALVSAVSRLGLAERVAVVAERAESAAHRPELRGSVEVVVARSFGKPAVTAECAAGFLTKNGVLVVSEPPEDVGDERWPGSGLARLGLELVDRGSASSRFVVLRAAEALDDRFPRRVGVPRKRPLF